MGGQLLPLRALQLSANHVRQTAEPMPPTLDDPVLASVYLLCIAVVVSVVVHVTAGRLGAFDRSAVRRIERQLDSIDEPTPTDFARIVHSTWLDFLNWKLALRAAHTIASEGGPYSGLAQESLGIGRAQTIPEYRDG